MKTRYIIGGVIVVTFLVIGGISFLNSSIEYADITKAESSGKKVQVTGKWVKERESYYDTKNNTFTFYIQDDRNRVAKVVYNGAKPNNFEIATSVVVKGKFENGIFQASDVLTKCPSKYEGNPDGKHPENVKTSSL